MHLITVITPTTGKPSLARLVDSIEQQIPSGLTFHLLLWDDKRDPGARAPNHFDGKDRFSIVAPPGAGLNGEAPGSLLRSIGLMAARTPWVTFADDDVWWESNHLFELKKSIAGTNWASTLRRIWSPTGEMLGVDKFESVGDDPTRRVPYEMCDNNTMIFRRELGTAAARLYRETTQYNDDRLMYQFLKSNGGRRGRTGLPTVNHSCPERLVDFFRNGCS